jgi:hypothetical protein
VGVLVIGYGRLPRAAADVVCAVQLLDGVIEYPIEDRQAVADSPG